MILHKSVELELKDLDTASRTAVIAHCVYDNIDRTKDISKKGMFSKSWSESKDVKFYLNHDVTQAPGKVLDLYEDDQKAYTKVKFGTHTLGEDTFRMVQEGIATSASFGYSTVKSENEKIKGQDIRILKEVKHYETSVLTAMPANPLAGVISVQKSINLLSRLEKLEKFIRTTTVSDESIKSVLEEILSIKSILSGLDTADTHDGEPTASDNGDDEVKTAIAMLKLKVA